MSRFFSFVFLLLLVPSLALADPIAPDEAGSRTQPVQQQGVNSVAAGIDAAKSGTGLLNFCGDRSFNACVEDIVGKAINIVLSLVGIILLGYIMYAGFLWMSSGGETDRAEEAMKMIRHAVIGLLIVVLSFAITSNIISSLVAISNGSAPATTPAPPRAP